MLKKPLNTHPDIIDQIESDLNIYLESLPWIKSYTVLTTIRLPDSNIYKIGVVINGEITDMTRYIGTSNYHFRKNFKQN